MRSSLLSVALVCTMMVGGGAGAEVLFLAHFDQQQLGADFAAGGGLAATQQDGASGSAPGYFPGTPSGAADVGYRTPESASLALPAQGNLDVRQGTLEFFLKTAWDWDAAGVAGRGNPPFVWAPLEGGGHLMVYAYHHELSGQVALAFNLNDGRTDHPLTAGVSPVGKREVDRPWKKDEWHHIAVTWSPEETRIFADGRLLARRQWDPPLALPPVEGEMWIGGREGRASGVLVDELRIQDVAVAEIPVPTEPYPLPSAAVAAGEGAPWATIPAYRLPATPVLDGKVDEAAWQGLPWFGGIRPRGGDSFARVPTRFAVGWDEEALYVAVVCMEPQMEALRTTQEGPDSRAYGDDSVEIFLDPLRRNDPFYQMVFNTGSGRYDGQGRDASWDGDWTAHVVKGENQWSAEFRMPFATLQVRPEAGQLWGFNLARNRYAGGGLELFTWSPVVGFHDVRGFGAVRLAEGPPRASEEAALNAGYLGASEALVRTSHTLWQRQVERAQRQLAAREAPAELREKTAALAEQVRALGQTGTDLGALDEARVAMLLLGAEMDQLTAALQQAVPVGPLRLPAGLRAGLTQRGDLWYFATGEVAYAVDGRTGILAGMWERRRGRRLIAASADHYWLETVGATTEADELDDTVTSAQEREGRLVLTCRNPDLPGVTLVKEYWLRPEGTMLARRVTVSGRPAEKTLFTASARTYFDEDFRQGAYYQRLLHPAITHRPLRRATEITSAIPQPGFMGQSTDGCSQMCASHQLRGYGVGQFLLRVNDEYVYPPRALKMSYWTPWGWEMSWLATFLKPEPFSAETVFMLYPGDHLNFHQAYLELPEWQEMLDSHTISPWVRKTRMVTMPYVGWGSFPVGDTPLAPGLLNLARIPQELMRPDEMMLYLQQQPGDNWGEWPAADGEVCRFREPNTDGFRREVPAEAVRHGISRLHGLGIPHYRVGFYQFPIDASPATPAEEAGWYVVDKHGNPVKGWYDPSFKTYLVDCSAEFRKNLVAAMGRQLDYYGMDYLYFDYPYPSLYADWKGEGRVVQQTDWMALYRGIHEECAKRGAAYFINSGSGAPFADAGIFEGIPTPSVYLGRGFREEGWKWLFADPLLMMKLYEPPGFISHAWPWDHRWSDPEHDNSREMTNYALLYGMRTGPGVNSEWGDQLEAFTPPGGQPDWLANARSVDMYHRASMELGDSRLVDVDLRPSWWRQETRLEANALRLGPAHVLTCLSHYAEPRQVTLSAQREALGLQPGRRTFVWNFNVRPWSSLVRQPDPPPPGWDRLCPEITCRSFVQGDEERLLVSLGELPPLLVRAAAVTQVPGAVVSAWGQDTQFVLPQNLDVVVTGEADETARMVRLEVEAGQPCEILAWWPEAWGAAQAQITGPEARALNPVPLEAYVTYGGERFVRLSLPVGTSTVVVTPAR